MTDNKELLCDYCGKFLFWNNDETYKYTDPITGFNIGSYCSKECLIKDKGLKEEDCKVLVIKDKSEG